MKNLPQERVVRFICNNCNRISEYDVLVEKCRAFNSTEVIATEYKVCKSCGRKFY